MFEHLRGLVTAIITPLAKLLLRLKVSPDAITVVGTIATCTAAFVFVPRGELIIGGLLVTAFALFDLLDGTMARLSNRTTEFGKFLDSTLDRIADAAVFGSVVFYFAGPGDSLLGMSTALFCLISGFGVSYSRARAESIGMDARVGLMERADRLAFMGLIALPAQLMDRPEILAWGLLVIGTFTTITFLQRVLAVRRQALVAVTTN
ncbi:MAG TPA: CDP-alcohol phosphatidyltransferase family protein [Marmoricola sp.]|mgnify:FL=1|nr:CDP-alcohol phosphatidyltransferase family protein [Nocardioidaceae bacterium]MCO5325019.1 CDP-alcohol phosphatidyltransferase family protein [Nocardioidaceae bacterium]HRV68748.1 CDP-alcohol phosphatidyltransferase family protein [Marmoricola sp.]